MAKNVAKPNAHAFIMLPNNTSMKKSHMNDAKQICKGDMYTLLLRGFKTVLNTAIEANIWSEITLTKTFVKTVNSYVTPNKESWLLKTIKPQTISQITDIKAISIIVKAFLFSIEKTSENTK